MLLSYGGRYLQLVFLINIGEQILIGIISLAYKKYLNENIKLIREYLNIANIEKKRKRSDFDKRPSKKFKIDYTDLS